jgi:Helix-turn-helix domain
MSESFGAMLRRLRQAKIERVRRPIGRARWDNSGNISQTELSLRAGLDPACVNKLEAGATHPRRETVHMLAEALELDHAATCRLLIAAGYWPWENDQETVDRVLAVACAPTLLRSRSG